MHLQLKEMWLSPQVGGPIIGGGGGGGGRAYKWQIIVNCLKFIPVHPVV